MGNCILGLYLGLVGIGWAEWKKFRFSDGFWIVLSLIFVSQFSVYYSNLKPLSDEEQWGIY